jgi:hypothetical protein
VPEVDEFDLVEDDELKPRQTRYWLWISAVLGVGVFAFLVGVAFVVISSRFRETAAVPTPTPPPLIGISVPGTSTPGVLATDPITVVIGTPGPSPTGTEMPATPTPIPASPTPVACAEEVAPALSGFYVYDWLGCPTRSEQVVWSAVQEYQRGMMLWRSDTDQAYVLVANGTWYPVQDRWSGAPTAGSADRGSPPPGLSAPERGFGAAWAGSDAIFADIGWAKEQERGFCATIQQFAQGAILASNPVPYCTPDQLFNYAASGEWRHFVLATYANGTWAGTVANMESSDLAPAPAPAIEAAVTRPEEHGRVVALQLDGGRLDGYFDEWPDRWLPITTIVHGTELHRGPPDLSGSFQAAWAVQGLVLAVRVRDDVYRAAPEGTIMWRGDGLEIHFDRLLAADYDSNETNDDDYQIGISFGQNLDRILAYHWLPYNKESTLNLPGAVRPTEAGYALEVLIPWSVFDLDGNQLSPGMTFGFNISINDNDGDRPAQEKVASFSPARTTHDNPTQWATLILGE